MRREVGTQITPQGWIFWTMIFYNCNVGAVLEVAAKVIIQGPFNLYPPKVQDGEFVDACSDSLVGWGFDSFSRLQIRQHVERLVHQDLPDPNPPGWSSSYILDLKDIDECKSFDHNYNPWMSDDLRSSGLRAMLLLWFPRFEEINRSVLLKKVFKTAFQIRKVTLQNLCLLITFGVFGKLIGMIVSDSRNLDRYT